ncbi:hypothetical protein D5281_17920 [bacterium 1xD42-62]|uniref:Uncharacterized protein n=1 Tax=Parablautia muri TaxID=2320879 RepID=A0A9X5BIQ3_9FIRM|nr:hypothetical protein [Parablautia muri]
MDRQKQAIIDYSVSNGFNIDEFVSDIITGGTKADNRPHYHNMNEYIAPVFLCSAAALSLYLSMCGYSFTLTEVLLSASIILPTKCRQGGVHDTAGFRFRIRLSGSANADAS